MTEQYDVAAVRHHFVASHLEANGYIDDAAYHYGLVGENALKDSLYRSGVAAVWNANVTNGRKNPMKQHIPKLTALIQACVADIHIFARGRVGAAIQQVVRDPAFTSHFLGWDINIRYADNRCTPVSASACAHWAQDADLILRRLVLMI